MHCSIAARRTGRGVMPPRRRALASLALSAVLVLALASAASAAPVQVPFVGCPSDGQIGPEPAPKGSPKTVQLDPKIAARLAFYQSKYDAGILAPRGWRCIALEADAHDRPTAGMR